MTTQRIYPLQADCPDLPLSLEERQPRSPPVPGKQTAFLLGRMCHVYRTHKPTAEKGLTETSEIRQTVTLG